mmetsp:Transcript_2898/g.5477  ORF Transcript_2898/g.5477 Transcript_2898/m.5477 type:complete len:105 (+) Transcript_2898:609-923(+)
MKAAGHKGDNEEMNLRYEVGSCNARRIERNDGKCTCCWKLLKILRPFTSCFAVSVLVIRNSLHLTEMHLIDELKCTNLLSRLTNQKKHDVRDQFPTSNNSNYTP